MNALRLVRLRGVLLLQAGIAAFHKFDKAMQENGYVCSTLLEEVEEWTDAMVGKLEGMLRYLILGH